MTLNACLYIWLAVSESHMGFKIEWKEPETKFQYVGVPSASQSSSFLQCAHSSRGSAAMQYATWISFHKGPAFQLQGMQLPKSLIPRTEGLVPST